MPRIKLIKEAEFDIDFNNEERPKDKDVSDFMLSAENPSIHISWKFDINEGFVLMRSRNDKLLESNCNTIRRFLQIREAKNCAIVPLKSFSSNSFFKEELIASNSSAD